MTPSEVMMNDTISKKDKFSTYVKHRRTELGLTIREVAEQLNLSPAYICDIENGKRLVPIKFIEKAIQIFKIDETEIPYFYDIVDCSQSNWGDLNEYLNKTPKARIFLRLAKKLNLSDKELSNLILSINKQVQPEPIEKKYYLLEYLKTHNPDSPHVFGNFIKDRRINLGYSVRSLAKKLGISAVYLSDIEMGTRPAPLNKLDVFFKELNLYEEEKECFMDLVACSRQELPEITKYLIKTPQARAFLTLASSKNLPDKFFVSLQALLETATEEVNITIEKSDDNSITIENLLLEI